jgi:hypothetical protein
MDSVSLQLSHAQLNQAVNTTHKKARLQRAFY